MSTNVLTLSRRVDDALVSLETYYIHGHIKGVMHNDMASASTFSVQAMIKHGTICGG